MLKSNVLAASFVLALCLLGCTPQANVKPVPEIVVQTKYITCDIPESYFTPQDYPKRNWDWSKQKETDVTDFILEHRKVIDTLNGDITRASKVYNNCVEQAKNTSIPTVTTPGSN